jgi:hypothetical protein
MTVPALPLLIGGIPKPPTDANGAATRIVLPFPQESVGMIVLNRAGGEAPEYISAEGDVDVAGGWSVQLNLADSVTGVNVLAALPTNGVQVLGGNGITDEGLAELSGYQALTYLRLGSVVTDAGIAHLASVSTLTMLSVSSDQITDKAIIDLAKLPALQSLHLAPSNLTDAALAALATLPALASLYVKSDSISDAGLAALASSSTLQNLTIESTSLTNAAIAALSSSTSLTSLKLTGEFDDAGLAGLLTGYSSLQDARIVGPGITNDGILNTFAAGLGPQLNGQWFSPRAVERLRNRPSAG